MFSGCGDYSISDMQSLPDPCPMPDKEKKKTLHIKERLIYAPMSGVGGVIYDKDAVYIDLGGSHSLKQNVEVLIKACNEDPDQMCAHVKYFKWHHI